MDAKPIQMIVCAAIHFDANLGQVILGARHFDSFMHRQMNDANLFVRDCHIEGFIDNRGAFLTRTAAWKVAEDAGQILHRVGGDTANGGTLYSENLY